MNPRLQIGANGGPAFDLDGPAGGPQTDANAQLLVQRARRLEADAYGRPGISIEALREIVQLRKACCLGRRPDDELDSELRRWETGLALVSK